MRFTFVHDLTTAVDQARTAATEGHVVIMGGGDVIGQAIDRGLVDELHLHLAPMLLGGGTPLFRAGTRQTYRQRDVRPSSNAVIGPCSSVSSTAPSSPWSTRTSGCATMVSRCRRQPPAGSARCRAPASVAPSTSA